MHVQLKPVYECSQVKAFKQNHQLRTADAAAQTNVPQHPTCFHWM